MTSFYFFERILILIKTSLEVLLVAHFLEEYSHTMKIARTRVLAILAGILAFGSFARVAVLFLESLAAVRNERLNDLDLIELCQRGVARESLKMRAACIQAQADRASPVLLKAVLRAFSTAFQDFTESVSSPGKLAAVCLFALTSIFLPLQAWLKALLPEECEEAGSSHVVVVPHEFAHAVTGGRIRRVVNQLRFRRSGRGRHQCRLDFSDDADTQSIAEIGGADGGLSMIDVNLGSGKGKWE